jgi:hypothetical protein
MLVKDYNQLEFDEFSRLRPYHFNLVANCDELNRRIAREAVELIKAANRQNRRILIIVPVGPLDYSYWAALLNAEDVSCVGLTTMAMDEYVDDSDRAIAVNHPLSFRGYIQRTLVEPLAPKLRPDPANIRCPDPGAPQAATALIELLGGADVCFDRAGRWSSSSTRTPASPIWCWTHRAAARSTRPATSAGARRGDSTAAVPVAASGSRRTQARRGRGSPVTDFRQPNWDASRWT